MAIPAFRAAAPRWSGAAALMAYDQGTWTPEEDCFNAPVWRDLPRLRDDEQAVAILQVLAQLRVVKLS